MHYSLLAGTLFAGLVACNAPHPQEAAAIEVLPDTAITPDEDVWMQRLVPIQY